MDKIKILMLHIVYPLSMSKYWKYALKRNPNIDLIDCGPYTGSWIPWLGGMTVKEKYATPPNYPLPFKSDIGRVPYALVKAQLPDKWTPDLVLTINAGIDWIDKPSDGVVASVGTDGHCLDYTHSRQISDKFFNMHPTYSEKDDVLLHYVYDPGTHYVTSTEKDTDAVLIGMPYPQRVEWVNALRAKGVSVLFENGPIFDEYRELNNRARIGLNWSSRGDLNARVLEISAMRLCPVIDRVSDLSIIGFEEDKHYIGFSNLEEAVEKVLYAKNNPDIAEMIANNAYQKVRNLNLTYDSLVNCVLKEFGL